MTDVEQQIIGLISIAGESKAKAFEALKLAKKKDFLGAKEKLKESRTLDLEAHKIQTQLIQNEMNPDCESTPVSLLMVHAQDHYMTSQLAKDLIEAMIETLEN